MAENKMAQVAQMFGKKLNEEFKINVADVCIYRAKFTVGGLAIDFEEGYGYLENPRFEHDLLIGKAVIVNESHG